MTILYNAPWTSAQMRPLGAVVMVPGEQLSLVAAYIVHAAVITTIDDHEVLQRVTCSDGVVLPRFSFSAFAFC
jgi:hypothetical protein